MEKRYKNLKKYPRLIKVVTGLKFKEFELLKTPFEREWNKQMEQYTFEGARRERKRTIRENSTFQCIEDKMIFILHHYKSHPTQEMLGLEFDLGQSKVSAWINALEPILIKTLKKMKMLPARDTNEMDNRIIESAAVILDGSERPIQRPKYEQQQFYSGKKRDTQ